MNYQYMFNPETEQGSSMTSLELLKKTLLRRMNGKKLHVNPNETSNAMSWQRLSTEEVMRVACAEYIKFSALKEDTGSISRNPFTCSLPGLNYEENKDVQLAHLLLASADKIGNQQFDRGNKLLIRCEHFSSSIGSSVQRVAYYFAEALRERINRNRGTVHSIKFPMDIVEEALLSPTPELLACHQALPFIKVLQFSSIQAIIENVASMRKIHLIDLGIKMGVQWTVLMQALAERDGCPIVSLKITAMGTTNRGKIEETGKRLVSFAESMGLPFSFKVVMASDMIDLKEESFERDNNEAIVVYAPLVLRTMINTPDRLDSLMKVMRNLNPCLMVITEVEANHNSSSFFNRFTEALFFYGAIFDCLETCMEGNLPCRMILERNYFGQAIMNIVATDGGERTFRHVGIEMWRVFFARFGWEEEAFSDSSMYQARLLLKQNSCWSSCNLVMNKKCLTVGWKGTPLYSLSAWKIK